MTQTLQAWMPLFAESLAKSGDLKASAKASGITKDMLLRALMSRAFTELLDEKHREAIDFTLRAAVETSARFSLKASKTSSSDRTLAARLDHKIAELTALKGRRLAQRYPELLELMPQSWVRLHS